MPSTTLSMQLCTWLDGGNPSKVNYNQTGYLALRASGPEYLGVVYFGNPFTADGANVTSAKLQLVTRAVAGSGAHTIRVQRASTPVSVRYVTYSDRPSVTGPIASLSKSGALSAGTLWEIDVTAIMQQVADGAPFYSLVLSTPVAETLLVEGNMSAAKNAKLVVEYTMAPKPPASLSPAAGRAVGLVKPTLRWSFVDRAGSTSLTAIQVQLSNSSSFTSPLWDSGEVASSQPQLNLADTSAPALTEGQVRWWRVRNKDGSGLWSEWSVPTSWTYRAKSVVALTSPSGATVTDVTPPISWTVSGPPQARWQVVIHRQQGVQWVAVAASGERMGTATSWTPTASIGTGGTYRVTVDVFDGYQREATPGDPVHGSAEQVFSFAPSPSVAAPSSLAVVSQRPAPGATLTWARAEQPDFWTVFRDGALLARYPGASLLQSPGVYTIRDAIPPNGVHTWEVRAVVNGVTSQSASATAEEDHVGTWLCDVETGDRVCIIGDTAHDMTMPEVSTQFEIVGSSRSVKVVSAMRGYEGTISGVLHDVVGMPAGQTAKLWRDRLLAFKTDTGKEYQLLVEDLSIPVTISDTQVAGLKRSATPSWRASFAFAQTRDPLFGEFES